MDTKENTTTSKGQPLQLKKNSLFFLFHRLESSDRWSKKRWNCRVILYQVVNHSTPSDPQDTATYMISATLKKYPEYAFLYSTKDVKNKNAPSKLLNKEAMLSNMVVIKKSFVEYLEKSKHIRQMRSISINGYCHKCGDFSVHQGLVNLGSALKGHTVLISNKFAEYSTDIRQELFLEFLMNEMNHINSIIKFSGHSTLDLTQGFPDMAFEIEEYDIRKAVWTSDYKAMFHNQSKRSKQSITLNSMNKVLDKLELKKLMIFEIMDMCIGSKLFQ